MTRRAAALLLLSVPLLAGDLWVEKLKDPERKGLARRILLDRGTRALPDLREAAKTETDPEHKKALEDLIAEITKREPFGIQFKVGMPKMRLVLDQVNDGRVKYAVTVRNLSDKTVVLWPYVTLRIVDKNGNEVEHRSRRGRWGLRHSECYLEDVPFVTLEPGQAWSFKERIDRYVHDPKYVIGWRLPRAGTYTLEFTYGFDRQAAKAHCDPKAKGLNDPKKPWNQALEFETTFSTEMKIHAPPPEPN